MNVGYVRLSKDDDKRNYVSIENQKLIISQFAAEQHLIIDRWYEDDGISGYTFNRPAFNQLMEDLEQDIDVVFVKDFSRLGRHNAKVLLLLDEFQEKGKHLIVIDDNYDSIHTDDDTIGIKTWYNERYVKDTSKKIRRALEARQKDGTLMTNTPFGYKRNAQDKSVIEIAANEASYVKLIYELYIKGFGYRKIANYLTAQGAATPSMIRRQIELSNGKLTKRKVTTEWSDSMVKDILDNDFYIGTLRLRKRARVTVHGKDKRIPKEKQYIFENHHPAILDKTTFDLVQNIRETRAKNNYRGNWKSWTDSEIPNLFGSILFCKDCGNHLTAIKRSTINGERRYYICNTYNTKGKRYCSKAHSINETELAEDVITYIKLCRNSLCEAIKTYNLKTFDTEKNLAEEKQAQIQAELSERKKQLKILFKQKVKDLSNSYGNEKLITESYDSLQNDILSQIHCLELQFNELKKTPMKTTVLKDKLHNALDVIDNIIEKKILTRKDIEILIQRIEVDENGFPEITLTHALSNLIQCSPAQEMNRHENEIIYHTMQLILEDHRGFTSAKYLSEALTDMGCPKSKKGVLPYIGLMLDIGIIEASDNPLKPYTIIKAKHEIKELMQIFSNHDDTLKYNHDLHEYTANRRYAADGF